MAQTYKMMLGTSGKQWEQLTVKDDGTMTMTFHGTDREISHEVTENADGWLCYPGAMFPGLESGKWNMMEDVRGLTADVVETTEHAEQAVVEETTNYTNYTNNEPVTVNPEPLTMNQAKPKRQRKPRKPRVERQEPLTIDHSPLTINREPLTMNRQTSSTMKAIGMVAAATVALFVIYETGLLIPLGLIGLATGGILK